MSLKRHIGLGMVLLLLVLTACGDNGASAGDAARFCELGDQIADAAPSTGDPDAWEAFYDVEMRLVEEALSVVPGEIRSDFEALMARETALRPVFEAAGYDVNKLDPEAVQAVRDAYPVPDGAGIRIGVWEESNC